MSGMNQPRDDRARIQAFWENVESRLQTYTRCFSAVRILRLRNREGFYLIGATLALLGMVVLAACPHVPNEWAYLIALPSVYYIVDAVLVNTAITFISQQPIHRLRSVLLTILNVLNVGLAYAVQREAFSPPLSAIQSVYFSFTTLTTLGYGDIKPDGSCAWSGQLTVIFELITGLYLLTGVLSVAVSWVKQGERQ